MDTPEVPLEHAQEEISHHAHESGEPWIMGVALTAAVLAVLAAITSLMAEHHAEEAMRAQIQATDRWSYYQAKGTQLDILEMKVALLAAQGKEAGPEDAQKRIHHEHKQAELWEQAKELEKESEQHLRRHGPLSRGITFFQVAIAVGAISVLTRRKSFWYLAFAFGLAGVVFLVWGMAIP
jgi:hypothetical protein